MDWKEQRVALKLQTADMNYLGKSTSGTANWSRIRSNSMANRKNICRHCGGQYSKYMFCFHLDEDPFNNVRENLDIACKFCYMITHLNYGYLEELGVYHSKLTQLDVVRKSVDFIIKKNRIPLPNEIDDEVKGASLSIMELCSIIIKNDGEIANELSNYKVFLKQSSDTTFISFAKRRDGGSVYLFTESDENENGNENENEKNEENQFPIRKLTMIEKGYVDNILDIDNTSSTAIQMKLNFRYAKKVMEKMGKKINLNQTVPYASPTMVSNEQNHSGPAQ